MPPPRLPPDPSEAAHCDDDDPLPGCALPPVHAPPAPYGPPPSSSHGRSTFVTALIVAGSAVAFLVVCLSVFLFVRRRRQLRRRREALLEAALAPAAPPAFPDGDAGGHGEGEEVVHHAWHIRTVGLDEAAIESIALTRYRAGPGGVLGASDCTVCLGEFRDGELLRLLPKCGHAFHVPCIDTWLRAHVNCPLCRAAVTLDPDAAESADDPPAGADADAAASDEHNIGASGHEQPGQHANEQHELRVQIDQHDQPSSSPEGPHRRHGPREHSFRRVASMDSPSPIASAEEAREDEQDGGEKQGTGAAVCCEVTPGSGCLDRPAMKRSLSVGSRWTLLSRHCRTHSSVLPS
ncbi:hypothetical protein ACP70R_026783 [Stipagrostis hirtigluma subsp. patula]